MTASPPTPWSRRGTFSFCGGSISKGCATCERTSAEWIIERPAEYNSTFTKCFLTELADFHEATVGQAQAQVAGGKVAGIGGFSSVPIFMVGPRR